VPEIVDESKVLAQGDYTVFKKSKLLYILLQLCQLLTDFSKIWHKFTTHCITCCPPHQCTCVTALPCKNFSRYYQL